MSLEHAHEITGDLAKEYAAWQPVEKTFEVANPLTETMRQRFSAWFAHGADPTSLLDSRVENPVGMVKRESLWTKPLVPQHQPVLLACHEKHKSQDGINPQEIYTFYATEGKDNVAIQNELYEDGTSMIHLTHGDIHISYIVGDEAELPKPETDMVHRILQTFGLYPL